MHRLASRVARGVLATLALLVTIPAALAAQTSQTGLLHGRVQLADGRVIANAMVTVQQSDGSYTRTARSDELGEFRVNFLTPGVYDVSARQIGFQTGTVGPVAIRATQVHRVVVTLELATTTATLDTVTTRADPEPVSVRTTEYTRSLQSRERELLPAPRDANALLVFTPGARAGQVFGGSTDQANLYQLDGVTVNQPGTGGSFLLPNVDWIEDFRVIGPGAGAEYGNFQGGLINIVTKSGSNTLQGQLRTFYENRALNASNVNAFEEGAELDNRVELNAEVRGPIVRDRLYFYLSGQESRARERIVDLAGATVDAVTWLPTLTERREQKYYGKLTLQATERDIVNVSAGLDLLTRERVGLSAFNALDATVRGRSPSVFSQANWQRTLNSRNFLELKLSGYVGRDDELPYSGENTPSVALLDAPNTPRFVNADFTRRNAPASFGLSGVWDRYFSTGPLQHNLKVGGEYVIGLWREQRTRNGGLSWYTEAGANFDPRNPTTWQNIPSLGLYATADTGGRVDLQADSRNAALYVQDYLRINDRLSLSLGLRLGQWSGFITPGNAQTARDPDQFRAVSASAIDPRIGATVDVFGDGRLVTKAHWGRFHQNMFALFFDRAPGANVFTNIEYCDWNDRDKTELPDVDRPYAPNEFDTRFTCFPGANLFNEARGFEDYRQPYMDQITLGVEKSFGRHLSAELLYVNRRNRAILALVDKNVADNWSAIPNVRAREPGGAVLDPDGRELVLPVVYVRNDDLRARLQAGDVVPGFSMADTLRLTVNQDLVIRPVDEARRDFDQLQLSLAGAYARVSFNAALAWTRLTGNLFSVNGYFDPSGLGSGPFVEPNAELNASGNLANYSPWDLKVRVSGQLPWGFEGGAFLSYRSGDFWTPTISLSRQTSFESEAVGGGVVQLDPELFRSAFGQELLTETRGSRQFASQSTLNVRLQRVIGLGRHDAIVGLEIFNVFNAEAITGLKPSLNNQDPSDPSSVVGAVRFRQPPTTFRLNVQYRM